MGARTPSLAQRIEAFAYPTDAWALTRLRPGIGISPRADALLALGYPRIVLGAACAQASDELAVLVATRLRSLTQRDVLLLELVFGAAATAMAVTDIITALPAGEWSGGRIETHGYSLVRGLGYVTNRAPAATRAQIRARLAAKLDELRGAGELWRAGKALDVILNGRAGVERSGQSYRGVLFLDEYTWAHDDPEWVAAQVVPRLAALRRRDREYFDAQLPFLGGPLVLAEARTATTRLLKSLRTRISEQLTLFA